MPINKLLNLNKFNQKYITAIETGKYIIEHSKYTFEQLMIKTPILHGFARGNWFFSTGSQSTRVERDYNNFGNIEYAGIPSVISPSEPLFLFNNLDYIVGLEGGNSRQAPFGFLNQSVDGATIKWRAVNANPR